MHEFECASQDHTSFGSVRSGKKNCTQVLLKFHEYYAPVHELSLSTTNRCTQTQLIIKNSCTQLKYSSTHCNQGRSCSTRFFNVSGFTSCCRAPCFWWRNPCLQRVVRIFCVFCRFWTPEGGTVSQISLAFLSV